MGLKIPNCKCGPEICDTLGRVLVLKTCPACQQIRLDRIRGVEYAGAYMRCGDTIEKVLVKQKEFFSLQALDASPLPGSLEGE